MKIAVIGTGNVGSTLGTRWAQAGHTVLFGTRHPDDQKTRALLQEAGPNACAETQARAPEGADVVVLATPWPATEAVVRGLGDLGGKILVDCTNPIRESALAVGHDTSGGEQVASWAVGARVVKAFNSTGAKNMGDPDYGTVPLALFLCGDDADAKGTVAGLAEALGFEAVDCGPLRAARYLEPLAMLWIHLAYTEGFGPDIGFALLRR
jgi:NADPH-dependent F420 reductase